MLIGRFVRLLVVSLLLPLVPAPAGAEQPPGGLTFDDLFDRERTGRQPGQVAWRPDGGALTYVWEPSGSEAGEALWSLDPATGETARLLAVSDLPEAGGDEEAGIDAYRWSPTGSGLVIESAGDLLWLSAASPGETVRLTETEAAEEAPAVSPDGRRVAYVRDADLYVLDLPLPAGHRAEPAERRLTTDGEPGLILNATTDWVYWEEIWGRDATGFWWSPDSERIAYYRFDDSAVGEHVLLPSYDDPYPEPRRQRYPKAGTTNPEVKLGVIELATGETVWLDTADDEESYIARVHWVEAEGVAIERLAREQDALDLLLCDPVGGACRTVLQERHPTWINLGGETAFLPGGRFLWAAERDGWRHLYLYRLEADGPATLLRQLTTGDWSVAEVDLADGDRVLATAFGTGPLGAAERRLIAVDLTGPAGAGGVRELAAGGGWHEADPSPDGGYVLHGWSSADDPGWQRIERLETAGDGLAIGEATAELPAVPPAYDLASLPTWRFFEMPAGDGPALPAALLLPAGVESVDSPPAEEAKHPVIMYHYGGPTSQVVADRWASRGRGLWHKLMAQRGFGVLTVDNRASLFFGKAGEDLVHRRFGELNLAAQRAGVRYLDSLPWADAERIGLWGWSGGGSNTLYCMLNSPGTWAAGMAGAPVTDWRYYDTIWTERYLDSPEDNPDGYRASSAVTYAEALADPLLIVHGTADDNVHPQSTMALARLWTEAGLPFEMAIYPGEKHGLGDAASRHFFERMTEFFERHLAAQGAETAP